MTRSYRLALAFASSLVLFAAPASAQPTGDKQKALELYDKGNVKYNLGQYPEAIDFFQKAYEAYSAPEFLFNIAQSYRLNNNCERALFFYRRYLANKPGAANKSEVDGYITEQQTKCSGGSTTTGGTTGTGTTGTTGTTATGKTGT